MIERLVQQEQSLNQDVGGIRTEWFEHMQQRHNGRRAMTCHTCINFDYSLRATEVQLARVRAELAKLK